MRVNGELVGKRSGGGGEVGAAHEAMVELKRYEIATLPSAILRAALSVARNDNLAAGGAYQDFLRAKRIPLALRDGAETTAPPQCERKGCRVWGSESPTPRSSRTFSVWTTLHPLQIVIPFWRREISPVNLAQDPLATDRGL